MEKTKQTLITVDMSYDDLYVDLHKNMTTEEAVNSVTTDASLVSFALTPEKALELAKTLIDAVFSNKNKSKNEKN